jgi:hypothetical protein
MRRWPRRGLPPENLAATVADYNDQPRAVSEMLLDVPPPSTSRFGFPLVLSRVHWVWPELVAKVKHLTWTDQNWLRQVPL